MANFIDLHQGHAVSLAGKSLIFSQLNTWDLNDFYIYAYIIFKLRVSFTFVSTRIRFRPFQASPLKPLDLY